MIAQIDRRRAQERRREEDAKAIALLAPRPPQRKAKSEAVRAYRVQYAKALGAKYAVLKADYDEARRRHAPSRAKWKAMSNALHVTLKAEIEAEA